MKRTLHPLRRVGAALLALAVPTLLHGFGISCSRRAAAGL